MYARPMSSCQISQYAHPSWGDGAVFGTHCEQTHLACLLFMRADRNKSITRDGTRLRECYFQKQTKY